MAIVQPRGARSTKSFHPSGKRGCVVVGENRRRRRKFFIILRKARQSRRGVDFWLNSKTSIPRRRYSRCLSVFQSAFLVQMLILLRRHPKRRWQTPTTALPPRAAHHHSSSLPRRSLSRRRFRNTTTMRYFLALSRTGGKNRLLRQARKPRRLSQNVISRDKVLEPYYRTNIFVDCIVSVPSYCMQLKT